TMRKYATAFTRTGTLSFVITSCGGMFSVIVRRSTFTIWSTKGIFQTTPGPRVSSRRPRRNITPRSYSRMIRTNPSKEVSLSLYRQLEASDGLDLDFLAGDELGVVFGVRLPQLAVDEHEPRCAHFGAPADDRLRADGHRTPARGETLAERERPEGANRAADTDDEPCIHVVRRRLVLEQQREAERERNEACDRERAVRHRVQVDDQERDPEQDERDAAPARIQHGEAVEGHDERHRPERAGQDDAGVQDFEDEPDDPGEEQDRYEVRVDDRVEEARHEPRLDRVDVRAGEMERERTLRVLRAVAVQPAQQRGQRRCDQVDHVHPQRLVGGEVRRNAHSLRRPLRV